MPVCFEIIVEFDNGGPEAIFEISFGTQFVHKLPLCVTDIVRLFSRQFHVGDFCTVVFVDPVQHAVT